MKEPESKGRCIKMIVSLLSDDMPLVREELYANIPSMIPSVDQSDLLTVAHCALEKMSQELQYSAR